MLFLNFGGNLKINCAANNVVLVRSVGQSTLRIRLSVHGTWLEDKNSSSNEALLLSGYLTVGEGSSRLSSFDTHFFTIYGWPVDDDLDFPVTMDQLLAIEDARGMAGDVQLVLRMQGTLPRIAGTVTAGANLAIRISASEWVGMLDQLGTEVAIAVRVPSPLSDGTAVPPPADGATAKSRAQAVARLRQARNSLRDGRPEDCVSACRLVVENLEKLVPLPAAKGLFAKAPESRNKEERWAALRWDLASLLSAAHHDDEVTAGIDFGAKDAEVILALTASLTALVFGEP